VIVPVIRSHAVYVGGRRSERQVGCRLPVVDGGAHARWCEDHRPRFMYEAPVRMTRQEAEVVGWSRTRDVAEPEPAGIRGLAELYSKASATKLGPSLGAWPRRTR
jgi:hypothetical protein